jgi:hypothetical protein
MFKVKNTGTKTLWRVRVQIWPGNYASNPSPSGSKKLKPASTGQEFALQWIVSLKPGASKYFYITVNYPSSYFDEGDYDGPGIEARGIGTNAYAHMQKLVWMG